MNPNRVLWERGDFTEIAATMRESGDALVESLGVRPPVRVLDLGCGGGTTAVPLARLGAEVVGIDIARNLVGAGNRRAAAEGLTRLLFREGDACALAGVDDRSFDLTLSTFGAMFAPRPFDVAREMVRVTRPGGRIVMGNWVPDDPTSFVSQLLEICSAFTPPPPEGFVSPMTWGVEAYLSLCFVRWTRRIGPPSEGTAEGPRARPTPGGPADRNLPGDGHEAGEGTTRDRCAGGPRAGLRRDRGGCVNAAAARDDRRPRAIRYAGVVSHCGRRFDAAHSRRYMFINVW